MYIIGISAFYHDSAVALIKDGKVIFAQQEERLSRIKNDSSFPLLTLKYIQTEYNLNSNNLEAIVFYDKPFLKFERIVESIINYAPHTINFALKALPEWLGTKINSKKLIKSYLNKIPGDLSKVSIKFSEHHFSHAAASFYTSPFSDCCAVTIDGVGEWATCSIIDFSEREFTILKEIEFPDSLGILYSAFTFFCGFKVNSGEYKLMGLAPYGNRKSEQTLKFIKLIKEEIVEIYPDGSFHLNLNYFSFQNGDKTIKEDKFEALFGMPKRIPESKIKQDHCNFALAAQIVTEEIYLKIIQHAKTITKSKNLCLSGGVALNCVANNKVLLSKAFNNIFIHPNPGDAGAALGCALGYYFSKNDFNPTNNFNPYLGIDYSEKEIKQVIRKFNLDSQKLSQDELNQVVSKQISENKIVGWFQGRCEWGPRALGNRSILANPLSQDMQTKVNLKIKYRESFRPFAPIVLAEDSQKYFQDCIPSLFMQYTFKVVDSNSEQNFNDPLDVRLKKICSPIPAVTHLDHSARVQTVSESENNKIYGLIKEFKNLTGCSVLINTSFNVRGEPIVCSPEDAIKCFLSTEMDILVLENYIIFKTE